MNAHPGARRGDTPCMLGAEIRPTSEVWGYWSVRRYRKWALTNTQPHAIGARRVRIRDAQFLTAGGVDWMRENAARVPVFQVVGLDCSAVHIVGDDANDQNLLQTGAFL